MQTDGYPDGRFEANSRSSHSATSPKTELFQGRVLPVQGHALLVQGHMLVVRGHPLVVQGRTLVSWSM